MIFFFIEMQNRALLQAMKAATRAMEDYTTAMSVAAQQRAKAEAAKREAEKCQILYLSSR